MALGIPQQCELVSTQDAADVWGLHWPDGSGVCTVVVDQSLRAIVFPTEGA